MKSLIRAFRKPDWESKNVSRRLAAVRQGDAPDLLTLLPELAQSDPEPEVRIAALRRVDDLTLLERRMRGELEVAVSAAARDRLVQLVVRRDVDLEAAQTALRQMLDTSVLARIAEEAERSELRWLAIERVDRAAFRVQRCIDDGDAALRLRLLDTIDEADALLRIAEAVRKRDKRLSRAARDKYEATQRAAGDPDALRRQALQLAEGFAEVGRTLPEDREARLQQLAADWDALRGRLDEPLQRRVDGAASMAAAALAGARGEPVRARENAQDAAADAPDSSPSDASETVGGERINEAADAAALAAGPASPPMPEAPLPPLPPVEAEDFDAQMRAWRSATHGDPRSRSAYDAHRQAHRARQQAEEERATHEFAGLLAAVEAALEAGHAQQARETWPEGAPPKSLRGRHRALYARLEKLERWQRWSSNAVRVRLCEEAEALHGGGLHPDALAERVRALQQEWAEVDAHDPIDAQHGLVRRFRALCHRAIAPARPYFEKRQALRAEHAGEVESLIERCAELPQDAKALLELREAVSQAQRNLGNVTPQRRRELGDALRAIWARIDAAMNALREQSEADKRRLLAHLRRDLGVLHGDDALRRAKDAQQAWKQLPRGTRAMEDALWRELRELVDPLFDARKDADDARRASAEERRAAAQAILDEARALLEAEDSRLLHADAHVEGLRQRWRQLVEAARAERQANEPGGRQGSREGGREDGRDSGRRGDHRSSARAPRGHGGRHAAQADDPLAGFERELDRLLTAVLDKAAAARRAARVAQLDELVGWVARWPLGETDHAAFVDALQGGDWSAQQRERLATAAGAEATATDDPAVNDAAERLVVQVELMAGLDSPADAAELRRQVQMQRL
ncbi:MAG: DUF349 domain-containing protein, partial [Xanthomonadales bacterium]|nr:DUF349 domain-containing protein [Xanthomonadales bacterium]